MRRRDFISLVGGAAMLPVMARAQPQALPVIGFLHSGSLESRRDLLAEFLKGLADTGYTEGRNVAIDYRWAEDRFDRLQSLAADLVRGRMAVIATQGTGAALAAKSATKDIPIAFLIGTDPVEIGLIASLNRPGGNLTGVTILNGELASKRLELLHELVPAATLIAYLSNPTNSAFSVDEGKLVQAAARVLGVRVLPLYASTPREIETAFENLIQQQAGALLASGDAFFGVSQRDRLVALAARHRVPAMYDRRGEAAAGGLISYGTDNTEAWRQVGIYTGRLLKGEKPSELPVQQSTKVELIINLKTAKALGLTVPLALLTRADEVIE
jgi:putative ABC transport system substrate-binding protein